MRCKKCGEEMLTREGVFGTFYYCKNSTKTDTHPTVSCKVVSDNKTMLNSSLNGTGERMFAEEFTTYYFDCYEDVKPTLNTDYHLW